MGGGGGGGGGVLMSFLQAAWISTRAKARIRHPQNRFMVHNLN